MNKEEFLHQLTVALNLNVSDRRIHEQLAYYDHYITEEVKKGRSEEEVVAELGSPRLLAKTIIDAAEADGDRVANQDEEVRGTIDTEPNTTAFDDYSYMNPTVAEEQEAEEEERTEEAAGEVHEERNEASDDGSRADSGFRGAGRDGDIHVESGRSGYGSRDAAHGSGAFGGRHSNGAPWHVHRPGEYSDDQQYGHVFTTDGWGCLLTFLVMLLILYFVGKVVGGLLYVLSPVLLPLMVIAVILWLLQGIFK